MLSNIGDISEDVHTYVLVAWVDLAPEKVLFSEARPTPPKCPSLWRGEHGRTFHIPCYTDGHSEVLRDE